MSQNKIAFQGDRGSNSHQACGAYFPQMQAVACATFEESFEAVKSGACDLAMIPVENSVAGRVSDVHHLLPSSGLKILGERFMPIRFELMANKGAKLEDLKTAISHPMALAQCRKVIKRLKLEALPVYDTAGAARMLAETPDPTKAAIAPALAAEIYGLDVLMRDVEDERHNTTRFLVMTGDPNPPRPPYTQACLTAFVFRVRNVPAALYKAMGGFATNGVNMTKLESYMEGGAFSATMFYAEVEGRPEDRGLAHAIEELNFFCERFEMLGVFAADPFRTRV